MNMTEEPDTSPQVESILRRLREGDHDAVQLLFEALYGELHQRARKAAGPGAGDRSVRPTALVNEAYLRLARAGAAWADRGHFLTTAARAMRQIVVDRYRRRRTRADGLDGLDLDDISAPFEARTLDLDALDRALDRLAERDPTMAKVVELRFFGGVSMEEIARHLDLPQRTLERRWSIVRAWLHAELS